MTNFSQVRKDLEAVRRALGLSPEREYYKRKGEETNRFLSQYVDALEREASQLREADFQRLQEELATKEKMLSPAAGNYGVACECARIRDVLSRYARLKMTSGEETK